MLVRVRIKLVKVVLVACIHWMSAWVKPERCMLVQVIIRNIPSRGLMGVLHPALANLVGIKTEFSWKN